MSQAEELGRAHHELEGLIDELQLSGHALLRIAARHGLLLTPIKVEDPLVPLHALTDELREVLTARRAHRNGAGR